MKPSKNLLHDQIKSIQNWSWCLLPVPRCWLKNEPDEAIANIFRQMSGIEQSHCTCLHEEKTIWMFSQLPEPSKRARVLKSIGKVLGYDYVPGCPGLIPKKSLSTLHLFQGNQKRTQQTGSLSDNGPMFTNSGRTSWIPALKISGSNLARFEKKTSFSRG